MRIACLQFNPVIYQVAQNMERADAILRDAAPQNLDLLMLPELAFSGYNHPDLPSITPFLEPTGSGSSTRWAIATARRLNCHVSVGYPEITTTTSPQRYNSVVLISPEGEIVTNYRKSFLYYTDETWATEGDAGFYAGNIEGLGDVSMGICMDLNPYQFSAPWTKYEFSTHAVTTASTLILLTMAWLSGDPDVAPISAAAKPHLHTLSYWLERLNPLIEAKWHEEVFVALCNRCGSEGTSHYVGTSVVMGIQRGEVRLYGFVGQGEEKLLLVDTANQGSATLLLPEGN
ncbi:MAG: Carbon-nitrogen hydrolase [Piccolia ochrophora]|nr:MAG: Carbon-nitrogen hydrolase [Piccolia ochrophora]